MTSCAVSWLTTPQSGLAYFAPATPALSSRRLSKYAEFRAPGVGRQVVDAMRKSLEDRPEQWGEAGTRSAAHFGSASTPVARSLSGWTPIWVSWHEGGPVVRWCFTEGIDFTDPFFDQTVKRCLSEPYRLLFWRETSLDELDSWAALHPGLEPAGLVFHASRCGSTLTAQMFAGLRSALVLSEPSPLDQLLRSDEHEPGLEEAEVAARLRHVVSALGQPRRPTHRRLVVKLDAWAVLWWPVIRRAFPTAPCVFLYREPAEVVASHLARRGSHMLPGFLPPGRLLDGFSIAAWRPGRRAGPRPPAGSTTRSPSNLPSGTAPWLSPLCSGPPSRARQGQVQLCHYRELPELVPDRLAPLFGVDPGLDGTAKFADIASRDSRNPLLPFSGGPDREHQLPPSVEAAVEASARPLYASMEALRTAQLEGAIDGVLAPSP